MMAAARSAGSTTKTAPSVMTGKPRPKITRPVYTETDAAFQARIQRAVEKPGRLLFVAQSAYFTLKFDDMLHERWYGPQTETQKKNPCRWVSILSSTDLFIGGIVLSRERIHGNLPATHKFEFATISGLEERRFGGNAVMETVPGQSGRGCST